MLRNLSTLLLAVALAGPAIPLMADEHDQQKTRRYYDKEGRDWHEWNQTEDRAYRNWLQENHREYRDFPKVNRKDQKEYWKWRHEHPNQ